LFVGISVVTAETDELAQEKLAEYIRYASPEAGLAHFSSSVGIDLAQFAPKPNSGAKKKRKRIEKPGGPNQNTGNNQQGGNNQGGNRPQGQNGPGGNRPPGQGGPQGNRPP
ncbi:MAG: hypothetical protein RR411_08105, partial [Chryseobacterium sp.]